MTLKIALVIAGFVRGTDNFKQIEDYIKKKQSLRILHFYSCIR